MIALAIVVICTLLTLYFFRKGINDFVEVFLHSLLGLLVGVSVWLVTGAVACGIVGYKTDIIPTDNEKVVKIVRIIDDEFLNKHLLLEIPYEDELQIVVK